MRLVLVLALTFLGAIVASGVRADDWNKVTVITFSEPVEIPGQILPAGTYTLKLVNIDTERHVVQFLDQSGTHVIATVLAINNWRLHPTGKTVNVVQVPSLDNALKHVNVATQTVGVYPFSRKAELRDRLATAGVQRITRLGEAGSPPNGNPHDAMYPLQRFVHWMSDEESGTFSGN